MSRRAAPEANRAAARSAEVLLKHRWAAPKANGAATLSAEVFE